MPGHWEEVKTCLDTKQYVPTFIFPTFDISEISAVILILFFTLNYEVDGFSKKMTFWCRSKNVSGRFSFRFWNPAFLDYSIQLPLQLFCLEVKGAYLPTPPFRNPLGLGDTKVTIGNQKKNTIIQLRNVFYLTRVININLNLYKL